MLKGVDARCMQHDKGSQDLRGRQVGNRGGGCDVICSIGKDGDVGGDV